VDFSLAAFTIGVRDAIIQQREAGGRAFFANAGRTRNRGLEAGLAFNAARGVRLRASWTLADYRFTDYKVQTGATVDTLDGKRLAGVPQQFARAGLTLGPWGGLTADLDQLFSSALFADDRNTNRVAGWGAGVTNLRLTWQGRIGSAAVAPFLSLFNLFDRSYIGSVTINGAAGRVLEPAPGRYLFTGMELGWGKR
jgi:iron complex outermembrane receptor protein